MLSAWICFLIFVWESCPGSTWLKENIRRWCPVLSCLPEGLHEWCFPPGITVAAKGWKRWAPAWLQSSESVFQRLLGNPPDSWWGPGLGGAGGLRQETVEGTEEEARHLLQRMLRPWARRERSSRQLRCSGENGFRSGRRRKVSESVTGDTTEGRWSRWNSQWIRKPHKWLLLLELDRVLLDKTQLSYIPCVKRQSLDKMSSKDPSN